MPIDANQLDNADDLPVDPDTNKGRVLAFLAANPDQAYRPKEVAEGTDVNRNSVGVVLSRFTDEGLVRSNEGYYAVAEKRSVATFVEALRNVDVSTFDLASSEVDELLKRIRG
jgi:DNA-binding IscR family transcriptional regulator